MNSINKISYDCFINQDNLKQCSIHNNNSVQGVYVGQNSTSNRLQCFKCVLKSKDLQCISLQNIFQHKNNESYKSIVSSQDKTQLNDNQIDISNTDSDLTNENEEYETFWPPVNQDLKERIKIIDGKLSSDILTNINNTFEEITQSFVKTMLQIKKETMLIASQVLEEYDQLKTYYQDQSELQVMRQIIEKSSSNVIQTNKELEEFIHQKYLNSEEINKEITVKIHQISSKLPQISDEVFQQFNFNLQKLLKSFRNIQEKKTLEDVKFEKSSYEKSQLLKIEDNEYGFQSITASFEGRGQIYSSNILDPNLKYEFVFEFDRAPKECIILGLTEDDQKNLNWYDRNCFYAIQLGKASNDSFCEKILKGKNIKQFFTANTSIALQVHINENKLYFADYPNYENVNALDPNQYLLETTQKYRIIIYFRNQEGLKLSLKSAHQIHELIDID